MMRALAHEQQPREFVACDSRERRGARVESGGETNCGETSMKITLLDKTSAKISPLWPLALAGVAFALIYHVFWEYVYFVGFPDGHVTALEAAEQPLAIYFNWINLVLGLWFLLLAIMARRFAIKKMFIYTAVLYVAIIVVAIAMDQRLASYLDNGQGG